MISVNILPYNSSKLLFVLEQLWFLKKKKNGILACFNPKIKKKKKEQEKTMCVEVELNSLV